VSDAGDYDEELDEPEEAAPTAPTFDEDDELGALTVRVRNALTSLPSFFEFGTNIEGVMATDLFALNGVLGAAIEVQVVATLNKMRDLWDPDEELLGYRFIRQSQTFPDVLLVGPTGDKKLGIELKGWYLLAKEGMPSLRYSTTPAACTKYDLLVVVPWHLSNVLSGTPVCVEPWAISAKYAAEYRNFWWEFVRAPKEPDKPRGVTLSTHTTPYPSKDMPIADEAEYDKGNNFGRLARVPSLMRTFLEDAKGGLALGIPIRDWVAFLKRHSDNNDPDRVHELLVKQMKKAQREGSEAEATRILEALDAFRAALAPNHDE
jgi:hypothetical protein